MITDDQIRELLKVLKPDGVGNGLCRIALGERLEGVAYNPERARKFCQIMYNAKFRSDFPKDLRVKAFIKAPYDWGTGDTDHDYLHLMLEFAKSVRDKVLWRADRYLRITHWSVQCPHLGLFEVVHARP